jgi:DNA-binding GntR family transcriptional regulator
MATTDRTQRVVPAAKVRGNGKAKSSNRANGGAPARRKAATSKSAALQRPAHLLVGRTLATDVLHRLRGDIIASSLMPGSKLRFETLRSVYHVSFSTLREGLSRLASEGLVVADGQRGFRVAPVSIKEMMDLTDARVLVEREVLRLAIARGNAAWRTRVMSAYHGMDQLPEQRSTSTEWNVAHGEFHQALASACDSPVLQEMRLKLFDRAQRYRRLAAAIRTYPRSNPHEHREIMEAALAGDSEQACTLIERHIRRTADDAAAIASLPTAQAG